MTGHQRTLDRLLRQAFRKESCERQRKQYPLYMASATQHLQAAIDELTSQRQQLAASISLIDTEIESFRQSIARLGGIRAAALTGASASSVAASGRSVRETILDTARREGRFNVADITKILRQQGNPALPTSVSSIVARLRADGVLLKGDHRGEYIFVPGTAVEPANTDQSAGFPPPKVVASDDVDTDAESNQQLE